MYNETIMEHFYNPRNVGEIADADGVGQAGNPDTGDVMRMYLKIADGCVVEARHKTFGNAVAIAVSSMASLMVIGKTLDDALAISKEDVSAALDGIPPDKMTCSNMAPDAIKAAIEDYRSRNR
jgi:nitrogen fixation NifU-like protein